MSGPEELAVAAERVRAFLDSRATTNGFDPEIVASHNLNELLASDLRVLLDHIGDLLAVKAALAELREIGRALNGEMSFPRTEIGDAVHNLRGRAEAAERALAALRTQADR